MKKIFIVLIMLIMFWGCKNKEKEAVIKARSEGVVEEGEILIKVTEEFNEILKNNKLKEKFTYNIFETDYDINGNRLNYDFTYGYVVCEYNKNNLISKLKKYDNRKNRNFIFTEKYEYNSENLLLKRKRYKNNKLVLEYDYSYTTYKNGKVRSKEEIMKSYEKFKDFNDFRYTFEGEPKKTYFEYDKEGDIIKIKIDNSQITKEKNTIKDLEEYNVRFFEYDSEKRLSKVSSVIFFNKEFVKAKKMKSNNYISEELKIDWSGNWTIDYPLEVFPENYNIYDSGIVSEIIYPFRRISKNFKMKKFTQSLIMGEIEKETRDLRSNFPFDFDKQGLYGKNILYDKYNNFIEKLSDIDFNKDLERIKEDYKLIFKIKNHKEYKKIVVDYYNENKIKSKEYFYISNKYRAKEKYYYINGKKRINSSFDIIWYVLNEENIKDID